MFENKDLPFTGLNVLDMSSVLAGPLTGSFFAELGARVTKIENKTTGGDTTRQWKLPSEDPNDPYSAYYFSANYGKEVHLLDLTQEQDRAILQGFLEETHIVISNFQKKVASKLQVLPDQLLSQFPHLIIAQLSAYGFDDPRAGYDLVMQGETGWISMTGTDSQHLAKLPVAIVDILASHQMKEAILMALLKKSCTGHGSIIHVSLVKSAISALANQASNYLMQGHIPKPIGTLHPNIAPYGDVFTSKDSKPFLLAIGSDAQFEKLWKTLTFLSSEYHNFEYNYQRLNFRTEMCLVLQQSFEQMPFLEIKNLLEKIIFHFVPSKIWKKFLVTLMV